MSSKIYSLSDLEAITASHKSQNKTIAHCHGCFDLLHLGHIRHFESAKKTADILIVTLTKDKFINKGPGRPVFNENQRAEAIAALQYVDYVAINNWATAEETIKILKPNLYIKGPDYKDQTNDLTDNIGIEENAVLSVGGKIHITEDESFSSSKLINTHFSPLDENIQSYLSDFKTRHNIDDVLKVLDKMKDLNVLVIGDTIIDEYHTCTPLGKSSKSPTISTKFETENSYAGGILAIANHIQEYTNNVHLITLLGEENTQLELIKSKLNQSITPAFFTRKDGPTATKRRYLDNYLNLKLFEVTFMNDRHIDKSLENEIINHFNSVYANYDLIVLADFGHGFITPNIIQALEKSNKYLSINAQTNSNNFGYNYITKFHNADYISIDEKELRLPFGDAYCSLETLIKKLADITNCYNIQITLGAKGSIIYKDNKFITIPAFADSIKDSVGAGDAVLSLTSLCSYLNIPSDITGFIGNCTGSLAVKILGNEKPVYKKDLAKFISHFIK
ncbi:MAG: cytidyltransferase [Flavobacteriales bacterium]|nr:MAG: cytidyltransferase [Flavobacteriales bacterium]